MKTICIIKSAPNIQSFYIWMESKSEAKQDLCPSHTMQCSVKYPDDH